MSKKTISLPSTRFLINAVSQARKAVLNSQRLPPDQGVMPFYGACLDPEYKSGRPFVHLVVGWDPDRPDAELSHIEGEEGPYDGPGYTGQYFIKVPIPQDLDDKQRNSYYEDEDWSELIRCQLLKQAVGTDLGRRVKCRFLQKLAARDMYLDERFWRWTWSSDRDA